MQLTHRSCTRTIARLLAATCALALTTAVYAAEQSSDQQKCVNDMNKRGSQVTKEHSKVNYSCLRDANRGNVDKLGIPPQEQTAQACLTNDVKGKVAKRMEKVTDRDVDRCLSEPEQLPAFGYSGAAAVNAAAQAASLGVVADLFGTDLDLAVVSDDEDRDGARCQQEVLRRTNNLLDDLWKEALRHKKDVLKGKGRLTGSDPDAAAANGTELWFELTTYLDADARSKIAKSVTKLDDKAAQRCAPALTPLTEMFPGTCATAVTIDDLSACAAASAKTRFYNALAGFDALDIDCDYLDNGTADRSCESSSMKAHVLNRIGYGADAWSWQRINTVGVQAYIQEQLDPNTIDDSALETMLAQLPSLTMSFEELRTNYPQGGSPGRNQVRRELQAAKLLRAVAGRSQLSEILFDVWFNHFNVDAMSSGRTKYDISPYDRIAIRPYVLGSFRDMLVANARSPAMGDYLDNRRSKVDEINENYSRELLELHTLSVTGPFDENDVVEVARCLTGWREDYTNAVDGFEFRANWHDEGVKTMFNGALVVGPNGGEQDGIDVIDYLAAHAATANFVVGKLVTRFVGEPPPANVVSAAASTYLSSGGSIRDTVETILLSDEFLYNPLHRGTKVKRPHHLMASTARALGADPTQIDYNDLRKNSRDMGEDLYETPPPTGLPDASGFWTSPGTIITRFNEIERRARKRDGYSFTYPVTGAETAEEIVDALATMLLPGGASDDTRDTAVAFVQALGVSDAEKVEQAAAFLMSSPEFLQH